MVRLIGITGIVISCGLLGIAKTTNLKTRIEMLEDYYELIIHLKSQIGYFKEPLPELLDKLSENGNSKGFLFLKALVDEIKEKGSYSADFWARNIDLIYKDSPITKDDIEIMSYAGEFIGQTDYINHLQHFSYLEEKIQNQIATAKYMYMKKGPMYNKIGFFLGALIGILLI